MNILFITDDIYANAGGIERVTDIQTQIFISHGHHCYAVCRTGENKHFTHVERIKYTSADRYTCPSLLVDKLAQTVTAFARENHIDLIVNTRDWPLLSSIAQVSARTLHIKHINYIHHQVYDRDSVYRDILLSPPSWKRTVKKTLFPLYWLCRRKVLSRNYRLLYNQCDVMVLLSEQFRQAALTELANDGGKKLYVISNPITFTQEPTETIISQKKKQVLIVARMEEHSKNISGALRIWATIERQLSENDWSLEIVGDGPDLPTYQSIVQREHLQRVHFLGHIGEVQQLASLYAQSSIFMMTSNFEGFGMTLIEAQYFGCVPVVFDNFASLHDIVEDTKNGRIIPTNAYSQYVDALSELMQDASQRETMARQAMQSYTRFNRENHYTLWENLFHDLQINSLATPENPN